MTQFPEAQDGQPLLTALFREGHMRFHWCDTSSPLLHGYKMRGLVKYNVCGRGTGRLSFLFAKAE
jgi:hypothetical protein